MLKVRIITRTDLVFNGEALSVSLPALKGTMEILDQHIPIITILTTGVIRIQLADGIQYFSISKGIASLIDSELTILSDASEYAPAIDLERAVKSKERALERLKNFASGTYEHRRAAYSLKRAENRIKLVDKINNL